MDNNNSNTNTILIVAVLLILVGGAVWFFTQSAPVEQPGMEIDVNLPTGGGDEETAN